MPAITNRRALFLVCLTTLCYLISCNKGEVYYQFSSIPNNTWNVNDALVFSVDAINFSTDSTYSISVELTHNNNYRYKNIFLSISHTFNHTVVENDTLECFLMDDHNRWKGTGNGATRQFSALYKTNIKVDTALHHEITIRHAMRDINLKGIERVGVRIY